MSLSSKMVSRLMMLLLILLVSKSNANQFKSDSMCSITREVLCVKQVLEIITITVKITARTISEVEKNILSSDINIDAVSHMLKHKFHKIHAQLPTHQYHTKCLGLNNINKTYLVHLLLEAHDAMSFYYNSIDDILNVSSVFSSNDQLKQIQDNLRDKIICEYRSVLNVYSHEWTPINHIKRLEFALRTYPSTPSFTHNYQSIFVVQILNEWMKRIDSVIIKLRTENFLIVKAS
ncbi:unnamed protein product [Rotaria magnacalcarata]|uniref:Uncharacterized protein n=2 Tax=Rotaria magnacalcarata TaxID=392030 RepID=A0A816ETG2_9BILA|nr:unnamed protein product [Rotaria magnacalcarata]